MSQTKSRPRGACSHAVHVVHAYTPSTWQAFFSSPMTKLTPSDIDLSPDDKRATINLRAFMDPCPPLANELTPLRRASLLLSIIINIIVIIIIIKTIIRVLCSQARLPAVQRAWRSPPACGRLPRAGGRYDHSEGRAARDDRGASHGAGLEIGPRSRRDHAEICILRPIDSLIRSGLIHSTHVSASRIRRS